MIIWCITSALSQVGVPLRCTEGLHCIDWEFMGLLTKSLETFCEKSGVLINGSEYFFALHLVFLLENYPCGIAAYVGSSV